jgi:hypothetical protein
MSAGWLLAGITLGMHTSPEGQLLPCALHPA